MVTSIPIIQPIDPTAQAAFIDPVVFEVDVFMVDTMLIMALVVRCIKSCFDFVVITVLHSCLDRALLL